MCLKNLENVNVPEQSGEPLFHSQKSPLGNLGNKKVKTMWPEINISVTAALIKGDKKHISRISKHSESDVFTKFIEK